MMVEIVEITEEFIEKSTPARGGITYDEGFDKVIHGDEVNTAEWLVKTFGGDIRLLCESKRQGEEMPDYIWHGKYWERKGISSSKVNTIHLRIKKAYSQIDGKRGGIILDFSAGKLQWNDIIRAVEWSLIRVGKGTVEIIIVKQREYRVLRVTKK